MKIGINGKNLLDPNPAGPEKYTFNIIRALSKVDQENTYVVYFPSEPDSKFWDYLSGNNPNFTYKVVKKRLLWTQTDLAFELIKNPVDVFFTTVHTIPIIHLPNTKIVSMIHGLEYPFNKYTGLINSLLKGKHEWYVAKYSDVVIVPSEATKSAILEKGWGVPDKKIMIVPEGVNSDFHKRSDEQTNPIIKYYELEGKKYFLFVSTIQPRKNLPKLVEAFSHTLNKLTENQKEDLILVVVGKKGWDYEESLEAPKKFGVEEKVRFLGRVSDEDLPVLYSKAYAFVSSSLDEGFGLPLLEAMASEIPCLVSDIRAFKEMGCEFIRYFNPMDMNNISESLTTFIVNGYPEEMTKKAKEHAEKYSWEMSANTIRKVFNSL